jgi:threonine/homoserine/homoserine lactone efflux protein
MIPFDTVCIFFAASIALALAPGPDNIFVLTQSVIHGRVAGLLVTLGLCTGILVHTTAVSLGVAAVFQTSALAFNSLKMLGVAYLLYLAWRAFRTGASDIPQSHNSGAGRSRLYARGVLMNVTNPKVVIFFLAFLPQFADPERGSLTLQLLYLGAVFVVATLIVFGSVAWTAGFLGDWLRTSKRAQIVMNRVAGTVFVALALWLVTAER